MVQRSEIIGKDKVNINLLGFIPHLSWISLLPEGKFLHI